MHPIMNGLFVASHYILIEFILTMCAIEVVLRHTQPSYKMLLIVSVDLWFTVRRRTILRRRLKWVSRVQKGFSIQKWDQLTAKSTSVDYHK